MQARRGTCPCVDVPLRCGPGDGAIAVAHVRCYLSSAHPLPPSHSAAAVSCCHRCYAGFGASDNGGAGDVQVAAGLIPNCAYPKRAITQCPNSCSFRGTCSGAPAWTCTCPAPYTGAACELVMCPTAASWFDDPLSATAAGSHAVTTCSNRGTCRATFSSARCDVHSEGERSLH